jgi:glycosyltransferase involved in cell wall biosynthesis
MRVAYLLGRYPTVSNTFVYREIAALHRAGMGVDTYALSWTKQPDHQILDASKILCVPTAHAVVLCDALSAELTASWCAHGGRRKDLRRARWLARQWRRTGVTCVHVHFLGFSAALAAAACSIADIPLIVTIHARGILVPDELAAFTLGRAEAVLTISEATAALVDAHAGRSSDVLPVPIAPAAVSPRRTGPLHVLTVGRCVPKKGYATLRAALSTVDVPWRWTVAGATEGELGGPMSGMSALGAVSFHVIDGCYAEGVDIFAMACRRAPDGDADGVPVAILEAMARGVAVVTTPVGGITELIRHGETGLLVPSQDPEAMARALTLLARNPEIRIRLGENGRNHVRETRKPAAHIHALMDRLAAVSEMVL